MQVFIIDSSHQDCLRTELLKHFGEATGRFDPQRATARLEFKASMDGSEEHLNQSKGKSTIHSFGVSALLLSFRALLVPV